MSTEPTHIHEEELSEEQLDQVSGGKGPGYVPAPTPPPGIDDNQGFSIPQ